MGWLHIEEQRQIEEKHIEKRILSILLLLVVLKGI